MQLCYCNIIIRGYKCSQYMLIISEKRVYLYHLLYGTYNYTCSHVLLRNT